MVTIEKIMFDAVVYIILNMFREERIIYTPPDQLTKSAAQATKSIETVEIDKKETITIVV
jgi:hypothetical protein